VVARITVMTSKALLTIALLVGGAPASAQLSRRTFGGLPRWADSALVAAGLGQRFVLSSELNTIYEFGDFDRDGLLDVAVQIKDTGGLRHGIAIVHRIDRSVHVVGAGRPIGNGKDQLNWRASWGVASLRPAPGHARFGSDLLYISQPDAPGGWGGWVVWDGRDYVWMDGE
jgi:hypothetical protein